MSFDFALIDNDLKILSNGTMKTVTDTPKLRQDILKIILTSLGSNKFHPWYGCTVGEDVIGKNLPENMMTMDIQASVNQCLNRLKRLQMQQLATQKVTLGEIINIIDEVIVQRFYEDPRQIRIAVTVFTRSLTKIEEVFRANI